MRIFNVDEFIRVLEKYNFSCEDLPNKFTQKIKYKCLKCNYIFSSIPLKLLGKNPTKCTRCDRGNGKRNAKYSEEEIDKLFENSKFKRVGKFINSRTPIEFKCKDCEFIWATSPGALLKRIDCPKCCRKRIAKKASYNLEKFLTMIDSSKIQLIGEYKNYRERTAFKCKICEHVWETVAIMVGLGETGCPKCSQKKLTENQTYTLEDFLSLKKDDKIEFIGPWIKYNKTTNFKCKKCENKWRTAPRNIINGGTGCPHCNSCYNEKLVGMFLIENKIEFIKNFKVNSTIKCKKHFLIDFVIPNINLYIEYNGHQHYEPVNFQNNEKESVKAFEKQQKRDEAVRQYCKLNNINLLEIDGRVYKKEKLIEFLHQYFQELKCLSSSIEGS